MDVDDAAAELYGLPLDEFVAARDALAKRLKGEGSGSVSTQVKSMRKPTVAAWLVNQLVRAHATEVDELVGLGDEMRNATEAQDGARLRELTPRRKELVDALVRHARVLADDAGQRASQDVVEAVRETLLAATADPGVAAELQRGRLTHPLQHVGFGPAGVGDAAQVISLSQARAARGRDNGSITRETPTGQGLGGAPSRRRRGDDEGAADTQTTRDDGKRGRDEAPERPETAQRDAERQGTEQEAKRRDAERELEQAESVVEAAEERVERLGAVLDERREALQGAEATVAELQAALESARQDVDQARDAVQGAEGELETAQAEAEQARRKRRAARRRLE